MITNKIIRNHYLPDFYFCARYQVSPYRGCAHGCVYCDGRAEKYFVEGDFEQDIIARETVPDQLKNTIGKLREKGFISLGSGVTDVYQPIEKEKKLTARIAEILLETGWPALVITKSSLPLRDLDLWKELNERAGFLLLVSFSTLDEETREIFEPCSSSVGERLEMIRRFQAAHCPVGILAMPMLPGISDTAETGPLPFPEDISPVCIMPSVLTLRPGRQKELFMDCLRRRFPERVRVYEDLYRENRPSGSPLGGYKGAFYRRTSAFLLERKISPMVPHSCWKGRVSLADEVYLLLSHMEVLYSMRDIDTLPLQGARKNYEAWIRKIRSDFNRRRSLGRDYMDDIIRVSSRNGTITDILRNDKLGMFFKKVLLENQIFDYGSCRLNPGL